MSWTRNVVGSTVRQVAVGAAVAVQIFCPFAANCCSACWARYFCIALVTEASDGFSTSLGWCHGAPGYADVTGKRELFSGPVAAAYTCQCRSVPRGPRLGSVPVTPRNFGCPVTHSIESRIIHPKKHTARTRYPMRR